MPKILIVDDEIGIRELLSEILLDEGYDIQLAEHAGAARAARNAGRPDLVLLDIWMPDTDGITLLREWLASGQLNMPVVMMSGHGTIDTAVEATRIGAIDYLEKPIALQKLLSTVRRALQRREATGSAQPLTLAAFPRSHHLRELRKRLDQMSAKSRVILFRLGPGHLADLAARSLQQPGTPWFDLSSVSDPLDVTRLQQLQGGVIYVPELARLSRPQQRNLNFALDRLERFDLRIAVATEHHPDALIELGWDEGILLRLFEVSIAPPSMADIRDDLPDLATQTLQHLAETGEAPLRSLSTGALNALRNHPWPGGYGELRAAVKSLALAALDDGIEQEAVYDLLAKTPATVPGLALDQPLREAREAFERMYFEHHLRLEGGNMTRLAEKTGLERTHLYRKLKQLGIQAGRRHEEA
jgi:DNA-binding NtrC family response regulator